ncbi:FAD linked oxidase, N-terminal [Penicillium expansum]|uniref:FAD linked oxidase, N-terminal n=1 Tax=Penicillium expansum TaxID=27334 RepID=A0A0A2JZU8_PENEN|nr:FAD linked oxidase, N-terminal [Penicillium expansum]KGO37749.1 FAD linked oxidase, N-terminal [Penicillium expansum]KGO49900.1 FAD linked oxidase, N-terminal [Penicillium expansum]KGO57675.1 FAD linked oxidase, N-terminal [Penicillium expansum]
MQIIWRESSDDATYEEARVGRVFNHRRPERFPLAVVKATCEDDIVAAVKLAAERNCRVAVRSGGHSWAAWSVRDNSILIDLGNYKFLDVDPARKMAIASPSMTGREINSVLVDQHELMFPGGHCPDVGIGGFLLQGGMGWNCRNWGWAPGPILGSSWRWTRHAQLGFLSMIFANSTLSPTGFPGIVTKFHLDVIPYPKRGFRSSGYIYPISMYREAFQWVLDISPGFDQDTEIAAIAHHPDSDSAMVFFVLFVTMKNEPDEAEAALRSAQETRPVGTIEEWFCQEDSLEKQYINQGEKNPEKHRYCADNAYIQNDADVPSVLEEAFTTLPHKKAFSLWYAMNPCSRRKLPNMALSMQSDHYFALYTIWEEEKDDTRCLEWVRNVMKKVERHSVGAYLGDSDFQVRKSKYWSDENATRLMEIRRSFDPQGRICGYLDQGDLSGTNGLDNAHQWKM